MRVVLLLLGFLIAACSALASMEMDKVLSPPELAILLDDANPQACYKNAEARGPGNAPNKDKSCPELFPERDGLLCYKKCPNQMVGKGPVCWTDCESKAKFTSNGLVFCCESDLVCSQLLVTLGKSLPQDIVRLVMDIAVNPANAFKILADFKKVIDHALQISVPTCDKVKRGAVAAVEEPVLEAEFNELDQQVVDVIAQVFAPEKRLRDSQAGAVVAELE